MASAHVWRRRLGVRSWPAAGQRDASGFQPKAAIIRRSSPEKPLGRLKKRAEFLRVRNGARYAMPGLVLQARAQERPEGEGVPEAPIRFGFTASKKIGGAVMRNRARRRLKEAVRLHAGPHAAKGFDYVLIARQGTLQRPFTDLVRDLEHALRKIHRPPRDAR